MKLNSAPQNEAVMSNVGQIGEFRIRNSAKAFSILSSGLYANKIRAIIRELSCNAVDSHVAAGKPTVPFEIHLPSMLEPWFYIRDFGTGLDHEQVSQIYTTYFESTKTESNEFIGALGLGSKSPFSYTDNFTVTAIKDGRKGIYSAFINNAGVPSIALMTEEKTKEEPGVEVKFSVNDQYDYHSFEREASNVYTHFKLRPTVIGQKITWTSLEYDQKDIVPGIHVVRNRRSSCAIMGNIAYPIDIPDSVDIGHLRHLLNCQLEMHFEIGELDFQASREGLSYIPQTIDAIQKKLQVLSDSLAGILAEEVEKIDCVWKRAEFLLQRQSNLLWKSSVRQYVKTNKLVTLQIDNDYMRYRKIDVTVPELEKKYNIVLSGMQRNHGYASRKMEPKVDYNAPAVGKTLLLHWHIECNPSTTFVKVNTKAGAYARARYHSINKPAGAVGFNDAIYLMTAADKTKPVKWDEFLKALHNPPIVVLADTMMQKPRKIAKGLKNTILSLDYSNRRGVSHTWTSLAEDAEDLLADKNVKYYVKMKGFRPLSARPIEQLRYVFDYSKSLKDWGFPDHLYGVRGEDIKVVEKLSNWINFEEKIQEMLKTTDQKILLESAIKTVDNYHILRYTSKEVNEQVLDAESPFKKLVGKIQGVNPPSFDTNALSQLARIYAVPETNFSKAAKELVKECEKVYSRYPLLRMIQSNAMYNAKNAEAVTSYINWIDQTKGV